MIFGLVLVAMADAAQGASPGVHPAEIEARLAPLVGDWTIPGQEASYRETCEWYRNRSFVVCTSTDSSDNSMSQSILGYSASEGRFTYHNYGSAGTSNSRFGYPLGENGLVYTLERRSSAGHVRATTYVTPQPDGRVHFREERSVNGGPWSEAANFHYVRRNGGTGR
jgi:hypothetical protein